LHVEDLADAAAGLQRRDDPEPPEPIVLRQGAQLFLFARLEPPFSLELPALVNPLGGTLGQVLPIDGPVEERFEPAETTVGWDDASSLRLVGVALRVHDRGDPLDMIRVDEGLHMVFLQSDTM
jgi:hypothetical protein